MPFYSPRGILFKWEPSRVQASLARPAGHVPTEVAEASVEAVSGRKSTVPAPSPWQGWTSPGLSLQGTGGWHGEGL